MLNQIREFAYKQPAATAVIAFLLIGVAFYRIYQTSTAHPGVTQPRTIAPTPGPASPASAPPASGNVSAPSGPATSGVPLPPGVGGTAGTTPGSASAAPPAAGGQEVSGRTDPFEAPQGYVFAGSNETPAKASAGARGGPGGFGLPPVPPLSPSGGVGSPGTTATGPVGPVYSLTGVMGGPTAVAILVDKEGSHIVQPGDVLAPGVRVVGIDPVHGVVQLNQYGETVEVHLATPAVE